jgi:NAD(P)-dependent dehydrogenase (short-subunit alcohol dehydrogenase family)
VNPLSATTFTNLGYKSHARNFEPLDADLRGHTVVITGASGGLGLESARQLAQLGARVVIVARNKEKLETARRSIDGDAVGFRADLSLISEVKRLGAELLDACPEIDVLINNVGVLFPERGETKEGIEQTLATNLAGQFALTNLLLPRIIDSSPSRVINITSGGMYLAKIQPRNMQSDRGEYKGSEAYARTKRGQVIVTEMWAKKLQGSGVAVHSMHPGWVKTAGVRDSLPTFNKVMKPLLRTVDQGADTIVWLAAADEPGVTSGKLWFDRQQVDTHARDSTRETPKGREAMWDYLVELTGTDFAQASPEPNR